MFPRGKSSIRQENPPAGREVDAQQRRGSDVEVTDRPGHVAGSTGRAGPPEQPRRVVCRAVEYEAGLRLGRGCRPGRSRQQIGMTPALGLGRACAEGARVGARRSLALKGAPIFDLPSEAVRERAEWCYAKMAEGEAQGTARPRGRQGASETHLTAMACCSRSHIRCSLRQSTTGVSNERSVPPNWPAGRETSTVARRERQK